MSSSSHIMSNRNSTPEAGNLSSLRPPTSRAIGAGHQLRASADMATLTGTPQSKLNRPNSDFYGQSQGHGAGEHDPQDKLAQQWIADIDQYETTLEEMAAATLDQDFKDELSAIEQWFRVLSEAERTAALYALLQQTTQVQIRFFIQILQQMAKSHPMSGMLSPSNFDKDPMSSRLSDAMGKLNVDSARNSLARAPSTAKRQSGLDSSVINAMFPDAAAAIATEKAKFTQQTGAAPTSNRNSTVDRNSLAAPTISGPDAHDGNGLASPWGADQRPKSSTGQTPMGQFMQPPPSAGLRSPHPQISGNQQIKSTTITTGEKSASDLPLLSPYTGGGNWASMVNTPMNATFNQQQQGGNQADMVANATAMKLAALSTVNNRFALDDPRRFRRARSNDAPGAPLSPNTQGMGMGMGMSMGMGGQPVNIVMSNERGQQILTSEQILALQNQQLLGGDRSRPNSPGIAMQGGFQPMGAFASPQANGFLNPYNTTSPLLNGGLGMGMGSIGMGGLSMGGHHGEGYLSDHSDMNRGRSPRGRRGTSKPPEDPTDPTLLQDIPSWLRSLRLHKYTDNLKDLKWTDLVELDDAQLEARGVAAVGARRKMLKVFEQVKEAKATGKLA